MTSELRPSFFWFVLFGLSVCISLWQFTIVSTSTQKFYTGTLYNEYDHVLQNDTSSAATPSVDISVDSLPNNDYSKLIDLDNFEFQINHRCDNSLKESDKNASRHNNSNGESPLVLILVHSAPSNWQKRQTIRDTWGKTDVRSKLYFLIGATNSSYTQNRLEMENLLQNDIIQGNFIDAYRNMTYKHVMALKWFTYHCPNAKYLLKTDDDVFINSPILYDSLDTSVQRQKLLFCYEISGARVKRTYRSKWYVSIKEYKHRYYPNHCPGFSIIYSPDVAFRLYREAQNQPYFWIDDVHLTGTLAQKINATITSTGSLFLNQGQKKDVLAGKLNATNLIFFFTTPDLKEREIRQLWTAVNR